MTTILKHAALYFLLLTALSLAANAQLGTTLNESFSLNLSDDATDDVAGIVMTNSGATFTSTTIRGDTRDVANFVAASNHVLTTSSTIPMLAPIPRSVSFWLNIDACNFGGVFANNAGGEYYLATSSSNNCLFFSNEGQTNTIAANQLGTDVWYHVAFTIDPDTLITEMYFNGELNSTNSSANAGFDAGSSFEIGRVATSYFDGQIACFKVFNGTLDAGNISRLAEDTSCAALVNLQGSDTGAITAVATDRYDGSSLSDFNITLYNSTYSETQSTTSSSVTFSDLAFDVTYTLNFSSAQDGGYFNDSTTQFLSASTAVEFFPYQSIVHFNASEGWLGTSISDFNVSIAGTNNISNSSGIATIYTAAGTYTAYAASHDKSNTTLSISPTALSQETYGLEFFFGNMSINAQKAIGNQTINTFNITATLTSTGESRNYTTSTGTVNLGVSNGTYNFSIASYQYVPTHKSVAISTATPSLTFFLNQSESVYLNFFDQITLLPILNINLELISTVFSGEYTTNTGNISLELIAPTQYTLRFNSEPNYTDHFYLFNLTAGSYQNISLYMLNSSLDTEITATVIDQSAIGVEGAQIYVMRYNIAVNDYLVTEILQTNFDGKSTFLATLNSEFYKFAIYYNGVLRLVTEPTYLYSENINFQITTTGTTAQNFFTTSGIDQSLVFNQATHNFRFTYLDPSSSISQGCLQIYTSGVLTNQSCLSSTSGTILIPINVVNGTVYRADGLVTIAGVQTQIASLIYNPLEIVSDLGGSGVFIVFIVTVVLIFTFPWHIAIPPIIIPIWWLIARRIGLLNVGYDAIVAILVIGVIIAIVVSRRNR